MFPHEPDESAVPGARVEDAVEREPRRHVHAEAAAPAALRRVSALGPRFVVDFLRGRREGAGSAQYLG